MIERRAVIAATAATTTGGGEQARVGFEESDPLRTVFDVLLERRLQLERLGTPVALEGPIVRVCRLVVLEAGHLTEGLVAQVAHERLVARVYAHVLPQYVLGLEGLLANVTRVLEVAVDASWARDGAHATAARHAQQHARSVHLAVLVVLEQAALLACLCCLFMQKKMSIRIRFMCKAQDFFKN